MENIIISTTESKHVRYLLDPFFQTLKYIIFKSRNIDAFCPHPNYEKLQTYIRSSVNGPGILLVHNDKVELQSLAWSGKEVLYTPQRDSISLVVQQSWHYSLP